MPVPVLRLTIGALAALIAMTLALVAIGRDDAGSWTYLAIGLGGALIVALFAPAYFGIDRESHRRR